MSEGRPHVVDRIKNGDIQVVINTSVGRRSTLDAYHIRRGALVYNVLYTTTIAGARALSDAIMALNKEKWEVYPLQEYHAGIKGIGIRDVNMEDRRPREECGVFAVYGIKEAARVDILWTLCPPAPGTGECGHQHGGWVSGMGA